MVTPSQFIAAYPEFTDALTRQPALLAEALNQAYALTPTSSWPPRIQDAGAMLRAAQWLALSPFGRNLALTNKDGSTVYDARLRKLVGVVAAGGSLI